MDEWYSGDKVMPIKAPAFVLTEGSSRLENAQSIMDPSITFWQYHLRHYRTLDHAQLIRLSESPNPKFRDAASQVLLEREYNRVLEEERLLNLRKQMVLQGLAETNPELMQSLHQVWSRT